MGASATPQAKAAMTNVFYLILRRMRFPLVLLIVLYAISVIGLSIVPGVDANGHPTPGMGLFHAFYVISYTGTTIGFGELPAPYSASQRLWMTASIYMTVVGWSYSIVNVLALMGEQGFRDTLAAGRFARRIAHLREPFYIVCGCGETGTLVCKGLDRLGLRFVLVEQSPERLAELALEDFRSDAPMTVADASQPSTLTTAGLMSKYCRGVMALAEDDLTNQAIAVAVRLLAPEVPVLARVRNPDLDTRIGAFGGDIVINPFDRFAEYLASAVAAPQSYRLREILTGLTGDPLPEEHKPPQGRWIMCGYGRFGHAIVKRMQQAGMPMTVVDVVHFDEGGVDVRGRGTDPAALRSAGIDKAVGIVAGGNDDLKNLATAVTARDLKHDIFIVTRQNQTANAPLFRAFSDDLCMVPSRIVAREFLALITTPLTASFLALIPHHDEAWCEELADRMELLDPGRIPEVWSVTLDAKWAEALTRKLDAGCHVTLGQVLGDPFDRTQRLRAIPLLLSRGTSIEQLPADDVRLEIGDEVLLVGHEDAKRRLRLTLTNDNVLAYVRFGREGNGGWLWRKLTRSEDQEPAKA